MENQSVTNLKTDLIFRNNKKSQQKFLKTVLKDFIASTLKRSTFSTILMVLLGFSGAFGQVTMNGPSSGVVGSGATFSLSESAGTDTQWFLSGNGQGVIIGSNNNAARVDFTGSGTLVINATVLDDTTVLYRLTKNVSISGGVPDTPNNPVLVSNDCGGPVLQRSGFSSETGDTWYWQGKTSNGTFTNKGTGSTYTANEGPGTYYIRARSSTGEWSPSSGSITISTFNQLQPGTISFAQAGSLTSDIICYNGDSDNIYSLMPASNGDTYVYQWQVSTDNLNWSNINGETGLTFDPSTSLQSDHWYRRTVTSCGGQTAATDPVHVTVKEPLDAGEHNPVPKICYGGDPPELSATTPSNGTAYSYQWQISTDNLNWTNISGAESATYNPNPTGGLTQPTYYKRIVTSCGQTAETENPILVDVFPELLTGEIQGGETICYGEDPSPITNLTLPSGGKGAPYTYSWWYSLDGVNGWTEIDGETNDSYDPGPLTQTRHYQRGINSCFGVIFAEPIITVEVIPYLDEPSGTDSYDVCLSQSITINLAPDSDATTLRWYTTASGGTHFHQGTSYITPNITEDESYYVSSYYNGTIQCESNERTRIDVHMVPEIVYFIDADGDGYSSGEITGCTNPDPDTYVTATDILGNGDCDDNDPNVGIAKTWYLDADADGYYSDFQESCTSPGSGYTDRRNLLPGDCDDNSYDQDNNCGGSGPSVVQANNYVYSRFYQNTKSEMLANEQDQNDFSFFTPSENVVQQITYFDGLGRPNQQIGIDQTPKDSNGDTFDVMTHIGYDDFGRQKKEWLPYTDLDAQLSVGSFRTDAESATDTYYIQNYADDILSASPNPFSEKDFEPSPMNRVLRQAAPGEDWALGNGHEIDFEYQTNTTSDGVRQYRVTTAFANDTYTPTLVLGTDYIAGELYKNITYDENHTTGKNHSTEEFSDKQGRVVLKRTYADMDIDQDGAIGTGETEVRHDTYYVYDDFGNLTYVLPPKMDASSATLANINANLNELGYQYVYDHRNRLVEKRIPGKGKEYIVYNKLDQPVMTQDANMRVADNPQLTSDYWLFTKYDAFGRVAYTGKTSVTNGTSRTEIQDDVDNETILWEDPSSTFSNGSIDVGHGNDAYPTSNLEVLTINYYDDYSFSPSTGNSVSSFGKDSAPNTKGLATGSRVKVLDQDPAKWITTATYYDEKARPIYTHSENEYLGTVDIVETELDFVGKPLRVRSSHTRNNVTVATLDNFAYDHVGRLLQQTQCIGNENLGYTCGTNSVPVNLELLQASYTSDQTASSKIEVKATNNPVTLSATLTLKVDPTAGGTGGTEELITYNKYDDLGQLVQKKVGGAPSADYANTQGLQTVDYAYNVRGWLTSINDVGNTDRLFNFNVMYNDAPLNPLYNGNIAATQWRTDNDDSSLKSYDYTYDALNRIMSATDNTGKFNISGITYDKNGNIGKLKRMGWTSAAPSLANNTGLGTMDDLTYGYQVNSNKLTNVSDDNASDTYGFVDVNGSGTEYAYDANGNMTSDLNKGITSIEYNHLNLPTNVTVTGDNAGTVTYVYDADGVKLKEIVQSGAGTTETEYASGNVYENGSLQFFGHPEGYVAPDGSGGYDYIYNYVDHLGNVRLSYTDSNGNGSIDPANEIVEENNFYAFGMKHQGYNGNVSSLGNSVAKQWKFNGKELNQELGLDWYDYGMRMYDPAIARFMTVDIAGELMKQYTPYAYSFNSPVMFEDKDGNFPTLAVFGGTDPIKKLMSGPKVDMTNAPNKSATTAKGFPRNGRWFWRQMLKNNPQMFSAENAQLIKVGKAPVVDPKWVEFNPSHAGYKGKLVHHHVDQGRFAVGLPEEAHQRHFNKLHSRHGSGAKGFFRNTMKFMNVLAIGLVAFDMFSDNPESLGNLFAQSSGNIEEGKIYKNKDGGFYSISDREFQKNEDGEIESVTATVTLYRDYTYNEETGEYEGVGQYDQATVKQYKGKQAQEVFRQLQEQY